jgi:hypothetical protein
MPCIKIPSPFKYSDITNVSFVIVTENTLVADGFIQEVPIIAHFNIEKQEQGSIVQNWKANDLIIG